MTTGPYRVEPDGFLRWKVIGPDGVELNKLKAEPATWLARSLNRAYKRGCEDGGA
jgi:hypothetical protein